MNLKALFKWLYKQASNYNLFMLEEHEYDDDQDFNDPVIIIKRQKYKTWLYIILLIISLYILFYVTLVQKGSETIIISNITPDIFNKLSAEYGQNLSCPCTTTTLPMEQFVSNNVTIHSVCQSDFVSNQWIEGLYFSNASSYINWDFRKTAYSQFKILAQFCSFSKESIIQIEKDVNNIQFIALELLSELQVQSEVDGLIQLEKNKAFGQIISFLDYLKTTIIGNVLVSALGTNYLFNLENVTSNTYRVTSKSLYVFYDDSLIFYRCGGYNLLMATGFTSMSSSQSYTNSKTVIQILPIPNNVSIINGFFTACTPFEAILQSTLDCLYEIECIQLLLNYFPNLNQLNINWNNSILTSKHDKIPVSSHLNNLFIENWSIKINYSIYFDQCSPSQCTYRTENRVNFSYTITLFISLYGGLVIILRLIASYFIDILNHQNRNIFKPIQSIKQLNLFKNINNRTEHDIKEQRIITRIYLTLLFSSLCILCLFTTLRNEIVIITVSKPSFTIYNSLENIYSTKLQCPCSNKTITQQTFMSFSPTFHQICSSGFVHDNWIAMLQYQNIVDQNDWRTRAFTEFQLLSQLCQLANKTISDALSRFLSQAFIASSMMNEIDFDKQFNASINQLYQSTLYNFDIQKDITRLIMQTDQFYLGSTFYGQSNTYAHLTVKTIRNNSTIGYMQIIPSGIQAINSTTVKCVCVIDPNCASQAIINNPGLSYQLYDNTTYYLPGQIQTCLSINSLLLSTFQYLFTDSDFFPFLSYSLRLSFYYWFTTKSSSFNLKLLDNSRAVSRFSSNTTFSIIVKEMMVEQWHPSLSYQHFYEACAPIYCSYPQIVPSESTIGVIIILISMIGGIVVSLRMLTPYIVKYFLKFSTTTNQNPTETEQIHRNCFNRLKITMMNLIQMLHTTIIELNIFTSRDVGSNIDRVTAKRYGVWATRLYIILFLIGLTILLFYTIVQSHTIIKNFDEPSFNYYDHLIKTYGHELKCTCSKIASTYNEFVEIDSVLHSICSSQFVLEKWRLDLVNGLVPNLTVYGQRDYRRFISAHLQYLQGLCQLSQKSVDNSINELLTTLLVTVQLLSQVDFENRLNILIEESKSNAPVLFSRFIFFTQNNFRANAFLSIYGTDFEFPIRTNTNSPVYLYAEPVIYDNNCSCGISSNCMTQAIFPANISINGMKMGCIPSESFLASTLECFYDQSCLDLIQQYTNYPNTLTSLSTTDLSRFSQNTTIRELISNLFIENWSTKMNYSSYYEQCSPSLCSYTSIQKFNIFYTITVILGIQGGLGIILKWLCPKLIRIGINLNQNRKKRINPIDVVNSGTISSYATWTDTNRPVNLTSQNNVMTHNRLLSKIVSIITILSMFVGIILFSIYYARQGLISSYVNISVTTDLYTTISTSLSTSSSSPICIPQFKQISTNLPCGSAYYATSAVADVNADDKYDLICFCSDKQILHVLLGNDANGTFVELTNYLFNTTESVRYIFTSDMNNDNRVDLILCFVDDYNKKSHFEILFGNGNGTFQIENMLVIVTTYYPQNVLIVDINADNKLDIVSANSYDNLQVFLGNGNEMILPPITLHTGDTSGKNGLVVDDFNNDGYMDIAVFNMNDICIHIFFASTNRSTWLHKWAFTVVNTLYGTIVSGDFDGDNQTDLVFVNVYSSFFTKLYQYHNDTFYTKMQTINRTIVYESITAVTVGDLNDDDYLDIVVHTYAEYQIYGFLGLGNGEFEMQNISPRYSGYGDSWNKIVDFNNDNCQDIIIIDIMNNILDILLNRCNCQTH